MHFEKLRLWWNRYQQLHIKTRRALQGFILSWGSPLGWILIQLLLGRNPFSETYFDIYLYFYLSIATAIVFTGFGYFVGRSEEAYNSLSLKDALTGLYNNRFFHQRLHEEYARHRRSGLPLSLIHIDLDHFKRVNDSYGHQTGDQVLKVVSNAMLSVCRGGELVARVGGEEFCVILYSCSLEQAIQVAKRLQEAISSTDNAAPNGEIFSMTASLGVACTDTSMGTEWQLFSAADQAMYRAKRNGRDRIEIAKPRSAQSS